jgi:protein-S-isoprenylcysteine O-methyltransferase Ste14
MRTPLHVSGAWNLNTTLGRNGRDRKLADSLRRSLREVREEEESIDRWFPILSGIIWVVGVVVSVLDVMVLQHGRYSLTAVGIAGVAFLLAGLGVYAAARRTLGRFFSEAVRITLEHKLITSGPYHLVRHPIYLGEILYAVSIPMIANSLYGFVIMLLPIAMLFYRIRFEEKIMVSRFGQEYLEYARKTKKLIPYIY